MSSGKFKTNHIGQQMCETIVNFSCIKLIVNSNVISVDQPCNICTRQTDKHYVIKLIVFLLEIQMFLQILTILSTNEYPTNGVGGASLVHNIPMF